MQVTQRVFMITSFQRKGFLPVIPESLGSSSIFPVVTTGINSMDLHRWIRRGTLILNRAHHYVTIDFMQEFKTAPPNLLEESDYISFFNQFPFSDLFRYVLKFPREGQCVSGSDFTGLCKPHPSR